MFSFSQFYVEASERKPENGWTGFVEDSRGNVLSTVMGSHDFLHPGVVRWFDWVPPTLEKGKTRYMSESEAEAKFVKEHNAAKEEELE